MVSFGMLRRVALVRTDVSEELSASFIKGTRIGELGTKLAVTSNRRTLFRKEINLCFPCFLDREFHLNMKQRKKMCFCVLQYSFWFLTLAREKINTSALKRKENFRNGICFPFCTAFRPNLGLVEPLTHWVLGAVSPDLRRQESGAGHRPTCLEIKNSGMKILRFSWQ
jgi:hypothetical protein